MRDIRAEARLEHEIEVLAERLRSEPFNRELWERFKRTKAQRSPEKVAELEREMGLTHLPKIREKFS